MSAIFSLFLVLLMLGVAFLSVARFSPPAHRDRGFWVTGMIVTLVVTLLVATFDGDFRVVLHPTLRQLRELTIISLVVGLLTSEAVLVSRWALDQRGIRDAFSFLAAFTLGTFTVWFLTALGLWILVPWV